MTLRRLSHFACTAALLLCACQPIHPEETSTPQTAATQAGAPTAIPNAASTPASGQAAVSPAFLEAISRIDDAYAAGDMRAGIAQIDQLLGYDLDNKTRAMLLVYRTNFDMGLSDYESAATDATAAFAAAPPGFEAVTLAAQDACWSLALLGRPEDALPYCDQAVALNPMPAAREGRGIAYAQLGRFAEAIADYTAYLAAAEADFATMAAAGRRLDGTPLDSAAQVQLRAYLDRGAQWLATFRRGENPFTPALLAQLRSGLFDSNTPQARRTDKTGDSATQSERLIQDGKAELAAGRLQQAEALLTEALALDPTDRDALTGRATARMAQSDIEGARADATSLIALYPDDHAGYLFRAEILAAEGRFDEALLDADKAMQIAPPYVMDVYPLRGMLSLRVGDYDQTIADFNFIIEHMPEEAFAYYIRGMAYFLSEQDLEQAQADLKRALELDLPGDFAADANDMLVQIEATFK